MMNLSAIFKRPLIILSGEKIFRLMSMGIISTLIIYTEKLEYLGKYGIVVGLIAVASTIGLSNAPQTILIKSKKRRSLTKLYQNYVNKSLLVTAVVASLVCIVFFSPTGYEITIVFLSILFKRYELPKAYLMAGRQDVKILKVEFYCHVIMFIYKITTLYLGSYKAFILSVLIENIMIYMLYRKCIDRNNGKNLMRLNRNRHFFIFRYGLPMCLSALIISLYVRIDQFMIGSIISYEAAGAYVVYAQILAALYIPIVSYSQIISRDISTAYSFKMVSASLIQIIILSTAVYFVSICFLWMLTNIYEIDNYLSTEPLYYLLSIVVPVGLSSVCSQYLVFLKMRSKVAVRATINLIINIVLNAYFIPIYGVLGAVVASLISYWFSIIVIDLTFIRREYVQSLQKAQAKD